MCKRVCVGKWAEILNRVQNSVLLHHQIDQAFPFSAYNIEKLGTRLTILASLGVADAEMFE